MRSLSELLIEKKKELGSYAAIGRKLGGLSGQVIGQYATGKNTPSLEFAIDWKKAFNENLIDLLFADELSIAQEPTERYAGGTTDNVMNELILLQKETIQQQRLELEKLRNKKKKKKDR